MRVAFVFGSIPTRNDKETDFASAVVTKGDWLGQEAESVARELGHRHPGSAVSLHLFYPETTEVTANGVEWVSTRPWPGMLNRYFYMGKQWSHRFMPRLLNWRPDIVHWQMNSYAYTFHLAAKSLVRHGVPYVYQHHGPHLSKKPRVRKILKYPHDHAERGIYLTRYHEEQYSEGLNLDRSKNRIIRVGYNERFRPLDRAECREKSGFKGNPTLFWAAGINARKDPMTVLKAFERVAPDYPEAHFYMAGYGPLDAQVKALVEGSSILSRQVTLMGYVNNEELPVLENAADIFVMGSHGEGFALASMEAMACGLFPVLTTLPCFVEQTDNGRLGELFEPGDLEGCVRAMRAAIGDVERRESVRKLLPEAVSKLTWGYAATQLVDLYEEVLAEKAAAGRALKAG